MGTAGVIDLEQPVSKGYRAGTHRTVAPAATFERVRPLFPVFGLTRVANVTGLDRVGLPVAIAIRPNARSLAVSQGKGLDLDAARTSAVMESIEGWHAEHIVEPLRLASHEELRHRFDTVAVDALPPAAGSRFRPDLPLLWIEGWDLLGERPRWVPFESVFTDYTLPHPTGFGCFATTSNGLASGNHRLEATSHGLCEVIERDATRLWELRDDPDVGRIDLTTVTDPDCRSILDRFGAADLSCSVWETTSDLGVPSFSCLLTDAVESFHPAPCAMGHGCHPQREIALLRALTEAAQCRLTVITGSREDVLSTDYELLFHPDVIAGTRSRHDSEAPGRAFDGGATHESGHFDDDVRWLLERLRGAGIDQAIAVDLSRPELGIPVVRVVVPGLEVLAEAGNPHVGPRGRAALETRAPA